ncbi:hypothetical protein H4R20_001989, partial [Coemansia guatemalensis]
MYEYVRRQQELQPNMFATKTFQWMDGSMRDTSWVKSYSKNNPTDPLAYSSSSLFGGPRVQPKAGALGALQRSAASLTPHRGLFTLRRHRQTSDTTATRPPSGVSGTFWPRRRGFTVPSVSQAPPLLFSVTAARDPLRQKEKPQQVWRGRGRGATVAAVHYQDKGAMGSDHQLYPPIGAPIAPHHAGTAAAAQMPQNREKEQLAGEMAAFGSAGSSHNTSSAAAPFSSQLPPPPPPQLHSSFSPPTSPRPRTICHRARMLVQRARTRHHDISHQHSERAAPQFPLSPVLGAPEKSPSHRGSHMFSTGLRAATGSPKSSHLSPHTSPRNTPSRMLGGRNTKPRVLPRSPLANPLVIAAASPEERAIDDDDDASRLTDGSAATHANGGTKAVPVNHTNTGLSSDEEGLACQVCQRFKSLEWLVLCNARHPLCFGCVQTHVKRLLANTKACAVVCPFGSCAAAIPTKHLRACLPPQRMQQLLANRQSRDRPSGPAGRSQSMCTRWNSTDSAGRAGQANRSDDGFDAPIIVVQESHGAVEPPAQPPATHIRRAAGLAVPPAVVSDNAQKRLSASMPVLQRPDLEVHSSRDSTEPLLSERTSVEPGSIDSVVIAASIAADSAQTLSPESVGSRLRRVPKAQEHLDTHSWAVDSRTQTHDTPHILSMCEDASADAFKKNS